MLSSSSSSNRKPLSDLTNKLSATTLDAKKDREPTSSKVTSLKAKAQIYEDSDKKDKFEVETKDEKIPDVTASVVSKEGGKKVKSRPANLTNLGASSLDNVPVEFGAPVFLPPPPPPLTPGSFFYLGAPSSSGFHLMTPLTFPPPSPLSGSQGQDTVAYVVEPGYISLRMSHGIVLDISNDCSVRLLNTRQQSSLAVCGDVDSPRVAVIHPQGRAIVYNRGAEVQVEDEVSVKNAKFYPKGISFTANNLALVYLLDVAGAKTSSDIFHDLHGTNVVDTLFLQQCEALQSSVSNSCGQLDRVRYWRNHVSCWIVLPGNFNFFSLEWCRLLDH